MSTKTITAAKRAGLNLAPPRADKILQQLKPAKMQQSATTSVALAAVLEYFAAEVLELANNHAKEKGRKRITPRDIVIAIGNDTELNQLLGSASMLGGGYLAQYNNEAASRREKKRRKRTVKTEDDE
ncbi:MAG: hypothetical protein CMP20_01755 [Rickettsiales bacterium]|nr:hypothetical protein [Rickettsiales bacterium]